MERDGERHAADAERQRRLDALRALAEQPSEAQSGQPAAAAQPPEMPTARTTARSVVAPHRGGRRFAWRIAGAAVAALAVVAGGLVALHLLAPKPVPPAPDPLVVPVSRAGMGCLTDAAWSPDGKHIAALMTADACRQYGRGTFLVLYDAALDHPLQEVALDQAVLRQGLPQSVQQSPALMQQAGVAFYTIVWSADSAQVAVLAGGPVPLASAGNGSPDEPYFWALALVSASNGAVRVVATPPQPQYAPSGPGYNSSYNELTVQRFDLVAGTGAAINIPQALAYTWGADGSLTGAVPMPAANAAPVAFAGPGSPWRAFTLYETASLCSAGYYQITLTGSLWSPDGRFVVPMMFANARLGNGPVVSPIPTPQNGNGGYCSSQSLQQTYADQSFAHLAPLMAPTALTNALSQTTPTNPTDLISLVGVLSPTGTRLVVQPQSMPDMPWVARVYGGATAELHATITLKQLGVNPNVSSAPGFGMAWSPDGAHLLLTSDQRLYLLGARSLGG